MPAENCLPALFYITCRYTIAEHSFTLIIHQIISDSLIQIVSGLSDSVIVENNQAKFSLSEDNQLKSIPEDITKKAILHVM